MEKFKEKLKENRKIVKVLFPQLSSLFYGLAEACSDNNHQVASKFEVL
jgi:hypothetical protein